MAAAAAVVAVVVAVVVVAVVAVVAAVAVVVCGGWMPGALARGYEAVCRTRPHLF